MLIILLENEANTLLRKLPKIGLITDRSIQQEKQNQYQHIRKQLHKIHKKVLQRHRPKSINQYIHLMKNKKLEEFPTNNKANKLQGFRFKHKRYNLKGSEVHRSMSMNKILGVLFIHC